MSASPANSTLSIESSHYLLQTPPFVFDRSARCSIATSTARPAESLMLRRNCAPQPSSAAGHPCTRYEKPIRNSSQP